MHHNNGYFMKKYLALAAAVLLLGFGVSCQEENEPSVTIVCTTSAATDIAAHSATLNGSVSTSNAIADKADAWFIIGQDENNLAANGLKISAEVVPTTGGLVSVSATELEPETTYYYMLFASVDGQEARGELKSFSTLSEPKEPEVTTGDATDVSLFTATLNGSLSFCS